MYLSISNTKLYLRSDFIACSTRRLLNAWLHCDCSNRLAGRLAPKMFKLVPKERREGRRRGGRGGGNQYHY
jgi:hypothetical protein